MRDEVQGYGYAVYEGSGGLAGGLLIVTVVTLMVNCKYLRDTSWTVETIRINRTSSMREWGRSDNSLLCYDI